VCGLWILGIGGWGTYLETDEIFSMESLCSFSIADEGDSVFEIG